MHDAARFTSCDRKLMTGRIMRHVAVCSVELLTAPRMRQVKACGAQGAARARQRCQHTRKRRAVCLKAARRDCCAAHTKRLHVHIVRSRTSPCDGTKRQRMLWICRHEREIISSHVDDKPADCEERRAYLSRLCRSGCLRLTRCLTLGSTLLPSRGPALRRAGPIRGTAS